MGWGAFLNAIQVAASGCRWGDRERSLSGTLLRRSLIRAIFGRSLARMGVPTPSPAPLVRSSLTSAGSPRRPRESDSTVQATGPLVEEGSSLATHGPN